VSDIIITEQAAQEIWKRYPDLNQPDQYLRVGTKGGGCSGVYYLLQPDQPKPNDQILFLHGFQVLLNAKSLPHIQGMTIDYQHSLLQQGFVFLNPQETSTCGCGKSFSPKSMK
jgi:iron-sulfur cluster assembly protein